MVPAALFHAFGQRYELPLPLSLFVIAGAVVVLASFALVARRDGVPAEAAGTDPAAGDSGPAAAGTAIGGVSVLVLGLGIWCGLAGTQEAGRNLLPTLFWLYGWIVVPLTCGLIGDWTRPANPFAVLSRWADRPAWRRALLGSEEPVAWPRRLGCWPAVAAYVVIVCGELVLSPVATLPRVTATGLALYAGTCLLAGLLAGPAWLADGEVFTVLFATWGRLGFWRLGAPGRRGFAGGLGPGATSPARRHAARSVSQQAFLLLLLVSVTVDGLLATPRWTAVERRVTGLRLPGDPHVEALRFAALAAVTALAAVVLIAFALASGRAAGGRLGDAVAALMPSLLPIAFGYLLAHNVQYVLVNGQLLVSLIGNPLGSDVPPWNLPYPFDGSFDPDPRIVPTGAAWSLAVLAVVGAHIVAVVIANAHLHVLGTSPTAARRAELPWLAAMVAYTAVSLWLLAQPLVQDGAGEGAPGTASAAGAVTSVGTG